MPCIYCQYYWNMRSSTARAKIIMKNGLCLDSFWSYECHVLNSIIIIIKKKNNTTQRSLLNCFKQFIRNKHVEETELMANIRDDGSSTNRHHYVGESSNRFLWGQTPSDLTWGSTSQPWYRGMSSRSNTMHSGVYSKTRTPVNFTLTSRPVCSLCSTAMASLMF